jgi:hypothetical protein
MVELDCSCLVDAIKGKCQDCSPITHLIAEIKDLVKIDRIISFAKVDRTQNRASQCLANLSKTAGRTDLWR